jgi:hypothetical protein
VLEDANFLPSWKTEAGKKRARWEDTGSDSEPVSHTDQLAFKPSTLTMGIQSQEREGASMLVNMKADM